VCPLGVRVRLGVREGSAALDQRRRPVPHLLVEVDQPLVRVVDRPARGFEIEKERSAAEKRLVVGVERFGQAGVEFLQQLSLPAGPLEDRLRHRVSPGAVGC